MEELMPITREETYLAAIAGQSVNVPKPITRVEKYLAAILENGGTGGGGGEGSGGNADLGVTDATVGQTVKISAVDENGVPTAWEAVAFPSGGVPKWQKKEYDFSAEFASEVTLELPSDDINEMVFTYELWHDGVGAEGTQKVNVYGDIAHAWNGVYLCAAGNVFTTGRTGSFYMKYLGIRLAHFNTQALEYSACSTKMPTTCLILKPATTGCVIAGNLTLYYRTGKKEVEP